MLAVENETWHWKNRLKFWKLFVENFLPLPKLDRMPLNRKENNMNAVTAWLWRSYFRFLFTSRQTVGVWPKYGRLTKRIKSALGSGDLQTFSIMATKKFLFSPEGKDLHFQNYNFCISSRSFVIQLWKTCLNAVLPW